MSAGNDLKEHSLEPVYYVPNQRAEWRLPSDRIFSTDLFIANLGVTKQTNATGAQYGGWAGVYGAITQMTLYDGNVVLSQISDVGRWAGFKMFNKSNDYCSAVGQYYSLASNGKVLGGTDGRPIQDFLSDKRGLAASSRAGGTVSHIRALGQGLKEARTRNFLTKVADSGVNGTAKGLLRTRHIFDLLNKLPYIDTSIFKDFRIVVEMSSDPLRITRTNHDSPLTTCRPLLLATELVDDELKGGLMGKFTPVQFDEIEDDRVTIPRIEATFSVASVGVVANQQGAGGRNNAQIENYHINGFNNKTLGRMLLWKAPNQQYQIGPVTGDGSSMTAITNGNGGVVGNGLYASTGFLGEQEQIRLNGRNIFARSGVSGDNRRLAHMVDSWGNCAVAPYAAGLAYTEVDGVERSELLGDAGNALVGYQSFVGVDLAGERCTDLQIDFTRLGTIMTDTNAGTTGTEPRFRTKYNAEHNMLIWCEVKKAIVADPSQANGYNVQYL